MPKNELDAKKLKNALHYNPETGVFTRKKKEGDDSETRRFNTRYAGKRAGNLCTHPSGYQFRKIKIDDVEYKEHRLAFLYMTGEWPRDGVDHKDRNATNNIWSNLQESDQALNSKNKSISTSNTSGATGVSWRKQSKKWVAYASINGKKKHLGLYLSFEEAENAVKKSRSDSGYAEGHGGGSHHRA